MATAATDAPPQSKKGETFQFQAEVSRVMQLIIKSLYSNKEIFLRELVSNAADACDKKRFLAVSGGDASVADDLKIRVRADKEAGTVTIEDSGIGMTRDELISNLGSIATSGTSKFVEALGSGQADVNLIGQFGVGFYSSYLIADKVSVVTKSFTDKNAKQYRWESNAENSYNIEEDNSDPIPTSGTRIILHVKDGNKEFLENFRLSTLLKRYSEFISFPIYSWEEKTEMEEVPDDSPPSEKEEKKEGEEKDAKPKMKKVPKTVTEWVQTNTQKPIWMRRPREVEEKEYNTFYQTISREYTDPLAHSHFMAEGDVEFRAVLFTPGALPFALKQNMFSEDGRGLKLYVKRVFISDKMDDLIPRWLTFIRGVIDSEDLPLNVSREILQQSRVLRIIKKRIIAKSLGMFKEISERDNDDYTKFWDEFGRYIKAGVAEDLDNVDALAKLTRWASSKTGEKGYVGLEEYVQKMQPNQKEIYYVAATSRKAAEAFPVLEGLRKRDLEVLYLLEPVDEIAIQNLTSFKAKRNKEDAEETEFKLIDINKENFKMDDLKSEDEKAKDTAAKEDYKDVVEYLKALLDSKVGEVKVSDKLTDSASTIVLSQFGLTPTMERYMREVGASGMEEPGMGGYLSKSKILEINAEHPIIQDLQNKLNDKTSDDADARQLSMLIYELALLTSGYAVDDPNTFAKRVASLVSSGVTAPSVPAPKVSKENEGKKNEGGAKDAAVETEIVE